MGNEFNGKRFDYWTDYDYENKQFLYGVWDHSIRGKREITAWSGVNAPSKDLAIEKVRELNKFLEDKQNGK